MSREPGVTVSSAVVALLESLGVRRAYGVTGGPIAPICDALGRSWVAPLHCRHESGAAFAALEDSLASGAPAVVFVTTGPGITNALTGMCAARWEGGRVLLVSASTSRGQAGRWAFQETSAATLPDAGVFAPGPIFHAAWRLEDPAMLPAIARELASGFLRPQGFVAHLSVPIGTQLAAGANVAIPHVVARAECEPAIANACAELLREGSFAIWVGFGARGAAAEIAELAQRTGMPVMSSPRGKGIFPEDHPQYLGVTGFGGHARVKEFLSTAHPERILVLGTRLGEFTSFWDPDYVPPGGFVHVDVDETAPGAAYPDSVAFAARCDVRSFVQALLPRLRSCVRPPSYAPRDLESRLRPRASGPVRPEALLAAVQRHVVEATNAVVLTDAGNAFAWGSHALHFRTPGRYRTSTGWGAMGHAACGVIGAALGRGAPAVALVGDGTMLMQSEVSTAVRYGIPAAWVVLNDGCYGMIEQGMRAQGFRPLETALPETDFAAWARALGADGVRVEREVDLDAALAPIASLARPLVIDVRVDPSEPSPFLRRVQSLVSQTHPTESTHE